MLRGFFRSAALVVAAAVLAGCGTTALEKGNEAFLDGDLAVAEAQWKPLAEAGNLSAQHNLGILNGYRGDPERAAYWLERAVSEGFVPSMVKLAQLNLAAGRLAAAENLYRHAARWGDRDASEALDRLEKPVPRPDLLLAHFRRSQFLDARAGSPVTRRDPNERLNRMLDQAAPVGGGN